MKHFGSTFILCFLGFLLTQARAIPSWKSCNQYNQTNCEATNEFCPKFDDKCIPCSYFEFATGSVEKPSWCIGASDDITVTGTSLLTFVRQAGYNNNAALCPTFDACAKNCRKEYAVQNSANTVTLTSTFADTTDCVCDKIIFYYETDSAGDTYHVSGGTNFDTPIDKIKLLQESSTVMDLILEQTDGMVLDCYWEYSIGTTSSSTATLTGLIGLISASVVAFVLV